MGQCARLLRWTYSPLGFVSVPRCVQAEKRNQQKGREVTDALNKISRYLSRSTVGGSSVPVMHGAAMRCSMGGSIHGQCRRALQRAWVCNGQRAAVDVEHPLHPSVQSEAVDVFKLVDNNSNNRIDATELLTFFRSVEPSLSAEQLRFLLSHVIGWVRLELG